MSSDREPSFGRERRRWNELIVANAVAGPSRRARPRTYGSRGRRKAEIESDSDDNLPAPRTPVTVPRASTPIASSRATTPATPPRQATPPTRPQSPKDPRVRQPRNPPQLNQSPKEREARQPRKPKLEQSPKELKVRQPRTPSTPEQPSKDSGARRPRNPPKAKQSPEDRKVQQPRRPPQREQSPKNVEVRRSRRSSKRPSYVEVPPGHDDEPLGDGELPNPLDPEVTPTEGAQTSTGKVPTLTEHLRSHASGSLLGDDDSSGQANEPTSREDEPSREDYGEPSPKSVPIHEDLSPVLERNAPSPGDELPDQDSRGSSPDDSKSEPPNQGEDQAQSEPPSDEEQPDDTGALDDEDAAPNGRSVDPSSDHEAQQKPAAEKSELDPQGLAWYITDLKQHVAASGRAVQGKTWWHNMVPSVIGQSHSLWSEVEKNTFFASLRRHSRLRPDLIASEIGTKSELQVEEYIALLHPAAARDNAERPIPQLSVGYWDQPLWDGVREADDTFVAQEEVLAARVQALAAAAEAPRKLHKPQRKELRELHHLNEWGQRVDVAKLDTLATAVDQWERTRVSDLKGIYVPEPTGSGDDDGDDDMDPIAKDNIEIAALRAIPAAMRTPAQNQRFCTLSNRKYRRVQSRTESLLKRGYDMTQIEAAGGPDAMFSAVLGKPKDSRGSHRKPPTAMSQHIDPNVKELVDMNIGPFLTERGWEIFDYKDLAKRIDDGGAEYDTLVLEDTRKPGGATPPEISWALMGDLYTELAAYLKPLVYTTLTIAEQQLAKSDEREVTREHVFAALSLRGELRKLREQRPSAFAEYHIARAPVKEDEAYLRLRSETPTAAPTTETVSWVAASADPLLDREPQSNLEADNSEEEDRQTDVEAEEMDELLNRADSALDVVMNRRLAKALAEDDPHFITAPKEVVEQKRKKGDTAMAALDALQNEFRTRSLAVFRARRIRAKRRASKHQPLRKRPSRAEVEKRASKRAKLEPESQMKKVDVGRDEDQEGEGDAGSDMELDTADGHRQGERRVQGHSTASRSSTSSRVREVEDGKEHDEFEKDEEGIEMDEEDEAHSGWDQKDDAEDDPALSDEDELDSDSLKSEPKTDPAQLLSPIQATRSTFPHSPQDNKPAVTPRAEDNMDDYESDETVEVDGTPVDEVDEIEDTQHTATRHEDVDMDQSTGRTATLTYDIEDSDDSWDA